MAKYVKLLSVAIAAVLLLLCGMPYIAADEQPDKVDSGFAVVTDFGANGTDGNDDYAAFEAALATGKNLYVPAGNYYVSKTIRITDRIMRGSDPGGTAIFGKMESKTDPIILVEGTSSLYDMRIEYPTKAECEGAKMGEKVGVQLGSKEKGLQPGSIIRSLFLYNVGTALYNPKDAACNGVTIENMQIYPLFRGVDMQGENRMGNSYTNFYPNYHDTEKAIVIDSGINLEGSSFGETLHQINVEHNSYETACLVLKNAKNVNISALHLEGVNLTNDNRGYIYCENTSGYIGGVTMFFNYINHYKNSFVLFGDSDGENHLYFDVIHHRGLNGPDPGQHADWCTELLEVRGLDRGLVKGGDTAQDYVHFRRAPGAKGNYTVSVDYYSYYTIIGGDAHRYRDFVTKDENNLTCIIKHEPKEVMK